MFVVSQAFISMLAKRGTVLCVDVLGTTLMVLSQLLVALHPLVLFIAV